MKNYLLLLLLCSGSCLSAQTWDTLAPIPESFTFPVVAVADGKIHIMGGGGVGGATDHHFAYDPATNAWTSRAAVPYKAQQPAGETANGKIHFFGGGFPNSGSPLKSHYVYDPGTDTWAQAADLTQARAIHYAVTLDSVLYTLAGQGVTTLCQTYDPVANSWTTKNALPDGAFFYGAHVATEGHIYRFGGGGYAAPNNKAHRYDPGTDTWTPLTNFPTVNHGLSGAAIGTKIYLAGGYHDFLERDEVYIFDTETETYSAGVPLPLGRDYHNMVALDSCIYVVGGNHAIDETVKFQLLRFCPFQTSTTQDPGRIRLLTARYYAGQLTVQMPEAVWDKAAYLSLFDLAGRQVFLEKIAVTAEPVQDFQLAALPPGLYVVKLQTANALFTGKVAVR